MLRATLIDSAIMIAAILAGLPWGAVGVAAALAAVGWLVRIPFTFWLAARRGPVGVGAVWRAIAPPASIALAIAMVVGALRTITPEPTTAAIALVAGVALAITLAGLLAWPETRRELREVLASGRLSLSHS
jgi:PST family polysaccharide transporter